MNKALVVSDLHIHSHKSSVDRLHDCLHVLNWVFETAHEKGAKHIFFLGDLFHEQGKIDVLNYLRTFEMFMQHMLDDAKDIDLWLLVGNHDMYHKHHWDVNSIKPLTAIPRVHIIDKPTTTEIGGRKIDWMPHTANPAEELKNITNEEKSLLLGHLAVSGAMLNNYYGVKSDVIIEYDSEMHIVDGSLFSDWELVLLGHYHGQQKLFGGKVEYVGSPLQISFGEAFQQKHIILLDLDTLEREYIVNDFSPKHYLVSPEDIENELYDLNGHFVRVVSDDLTAKGIVDLRQAVKKQYQVASFEFKAKDRSIEEEQNVVEDAKQILFQEGEMLEQWLEEAERKGDIDGLDKDKLLLFGQKCTKQSA
jgi:DNA repair exonuclease SbcCD nuclease subunit